MRVVAKIENEVCPQYRELSSDRLLAQFEEDEEVQRYLPDENEKGHRVPRTYLVQILFVLRGDYMRRIVNHAIDIRHQTRGFRDGVQPIQLHPAVLEMLTDRVFLSSKSGKANIVFSGKPIAVRARQVKPPRALAVAYRDFIRQ